MESTQLLQDLAKLREQMSNPITHMQLIRQALQHQVALGTSIPMPQILSEDQRKVMLADVTCLEEFIKSEDGKDAVELMMIAFKEYKKAKEAPAQVEQKPQEVLTQLT
jgi:hypothetical protein